MPHYRTRRLGLRAVFGFALLIASFGFAAPASAQYWVDGLYGTAEPENIEEIDGFAVFTPFGAHQEACRAGVRKACRALEAYPAGYTAPATVAEVTGGWKAALDALEDACRKDDARACHIQGVWHWRDLGGDKAPEKGYRAFAKGCELGFAASCYRQAVMHEVFEKSDVANFAKGGLAPVVPMYANACAGGIGRACGRLSEFYSGTQRLFHMHKTPPVDPDPDLAERYGIAGCETGDAYACKALAALTLKYLRKGQSADFDRIFNASRALPDSYGPLFAGEAVRRYWSGDELQTLLSKGVDFSDPSILERASSRSLEFLNEHGVKPGDAPSQLLLHRAAKYRNDNLYEVLLAGGADPNALDDEGKAVLHHILLRRVPASIHTPDLVTRINDPVRALLKGGADPSLPMPDGRVPLMLAIDGGYGEAVDLLIEAGADPNVAGQSGKKPLHVAAEAGSGEMVKLLIAKGAEIDAQTAGGDTPLLLAVAARKDAVAEALLEAGADPDIRNHRGESAYSLTQQQVAEDRRKAQAEAQRVAEQRAKAERRRIYEQRRAQERREDVGFAVGLLTAMAGAGVASEAGMDLDTGAQFATGLGQAVSGAVSGNDQQIATGQYMMDGAQRQLVAKMEARRRIDDMAREQYLQRAAAEQAASAGAAAQPAALNAAGSGASATEAAGSNLAALEVTSRAEPEADADSTGNASPAASQPEAEAPANDGEFAPVEFGPMPGSGPCEAEHRAWYDTVNDMSLEEDVFYDRGKRTWDALDACLKANGLDKSGQPNKGAGAVAQ